MRPELNLTPVMGTQLKSSKKNLLDEIRKGSLTERDRSPNKVTPFTLSKIKVSDYKGSDCSTEDNHGNNISKVDIHINQHSQQVVVPPANIADKNMKMISYSSDTNKYVDA